MPKVGHLADMIVIDSDLERTPADAIGAVKVNATICDGRQVYEK